jgi:hypothetical protein
MPPNPYDPVADYKAQRGARHKAPSPAELRLLKTLSKSEVDALISIDNKNRQLKPIPFMFGPTSF